MPDSLETSKAPAGPSAKATAILNQIAVARDTAQRIERELRKAAPALGNTAGLLLSQKAFDAAAKENPDLKELAALFSLMLKFKQQTLAERKFELLQAKRQEAGAKHPGRRRQGGLSPETLRQIEEMANIL